MKTVFVVGYPRSGTTLLAEMISRLTGYVVLPETRFYEENVLPRRVQGSKLIAILSKKLRLKDLGLPMEACFDESVSYKRSEVLPRLIECIGAGRGVVEKSPIHSVHLGRIKQDFPDAIVVAIVRSPSDVLASLNKTPWNNRGAVYMQLEWSSRNRKMIDSGFVDHLVSYEELISSPEDACEKVMKNILGRSDSELIRKAIYSSRNSGAVPEWELGWKANVNGPLLLNKEITRERLPYIDDGVAVRVGYFEYAGQSSLFSKGLNLGFSVYISVRSFVKRAFYGWGLNRLVNRPSEGDVVGN